VRVLKLTIAYDGRDLVGWQRQSEGTSVQGLLEEALGRIDGAPVAIVGAGRTDAGVHATGQVASAPVRCRHDAATLVRALNAVLPAVVRVVAVDEAPPGFNARFAARGKTYHYRIGNGPTMSPFAAPFAWHVPWALDLAAMDAAARTLEGEHDFAAFQSAGSAVTTSTRRLFESRVAVAPPGPSIGPVPQADDGGSRLLVYHVRGSGFLRHMVRAIAGTLVEVGSGRLTPDDVRGLVTPASGRRGGPTAPAHGLCLASVDYAAGGTEPMSTT
jgi:tRNA pseudouridine38-40 synthase